MKLIILIIISGLLFNNLYAAKLDLSSDINASVKSYSNLINTKDLSYYENDINLGFTVKKIILEKTDNSSMDISIGFRNIQIDNSTSVLNSNQMKEAIEYYPEVNKPFINKAYVKIYNFYSDDIDFTFGRQNYTLGQGIVLSDNEKGFNGLKLEFKNKVKFLDNLDFFTFREIKEGNPFYLYGLNGFINGFDGTWEIYHFYQKTNKNDQEIAYQSKEIDKRFSGIRYFLNKNQVDFDGEFAIQRGNNTNFSKDNKIDYKGYAFTLKSSFNQKLPILGPSRTRILYSKSTGNSGSNFEKDRAFSPQFTAKYCGVSRCGYGEIFSASVYDVFKTSNTLNGLPDGISGLNTINFGFDIPYNKLILSFDYFLFKADKNTNDKGNLRLASETDLKIGYKLGEKLSLDLIYATLNPLAALDKKNVLKNTKLIAFNIKARF